MPLVILASWPVQDRIKEYLFFMLVLETGMLGAFVALDLFLFYVFWEVMLVPMYFLIGIWGGPRRIYAALKFVVYTMAGSLPMLVAIIYLATRYAHVHQSLTFDLLQLYNLRLPVAEQIWLFLAFGLSFAIKVPLFPFHTWLPDAHVEAPTAGSVILAGVLLKMGTYGFLRFAIPLFPDATLALTPVIIALAVIGIIYGAAVAMMQADIKKLVAYSSVSHLGFVVLGLFALNLQGIQGGIYQMISHGLSTGALFLLVGMLYDRRHTRMIADFGGLWHQVPVFSRAASDRHFCIDRLAWAEWLHRRILDFAGCFQRVAGMDGSSGQRRHSRRDLHALDVSTGDFRAFDSCGKPETVRFEWPGVAHSRSHRCSDRSHGSLSAAFSKPDETIGRFDPAKNFHSRKLRRSLKTRERAER